MGEMSVHDLDALKRHGWAVSLPPDAGLARLLREGARDAMAPSGRKHLGELAVIAEQLPAAGARTVYLGSGPKAVIVADELRTLLARAREQSDPSADALAAFLTQQFGVTEAGVSGG
jgi:hypothetical protein